MTFEARHDDSLYEKIVLPIALLIYSRCYDEDDAKASFEHLAENGWEIPSDILTRLGIMEEVVENRTPGHCHKFAEGWIVEDRIQIKRHPGEPTIFELIYTLCYILDWDAHNFRYLPQKPVSDTSKPPPALNLSSESRFTSGANKEFHEYGFRLGVEQILKLGLGRWRSDDNGFKIIHVLQVSDTMFSLLDSYEESRFNLQKQLGSEVLLYPPKKTIQGT